VTCLVDDADMWHASKRAVEENESSVTDERSRCWGKAAAPNEVIFLSCSSSSPSSIVTFDVKEIHKKKIVVKTSNGDGLQQQGLERRQSVSMQF
jgi:hypothetical protein